MTATSSDHAGERLLPVLVDEIAARDPDRVLYSVARTKNPADGFQDITTKAFARAVNRCAWHLEETLGRGHDFPTLMYMGPQDLVYGVLILACNKTGYKLLLNSPRNSLEAHLSLLAQTNCNVLLTPPQFPLPVVKQILAGRQMRHLEIFGLQHWLQDDQVDRPYPYIKNFTQARTDPFVVLHTSGSTGLPKPIVQTNGTIAALDAYTTLPSLGLQPTFPAMCAGKRVYLAFPLFHCAGLSMLLPGCIFAAFTVVLGPFPPSGEVANGIHVHANVQHSCIAPMTLVELVKVPEHLDNLARLEQVTFGGGPCPQEVGEAAMSKTRLLNCLGTTECGPLPSQLCDPEDWAYLSLSPVLGSEYRPVTEGLYEHVIKREAKLQKYQAVFETFPDLEEWPMKDLYSKHPTKENLWMYRGRTDDIIVFHTGEKFNPIDMEVSIGAHPSISGALVAGFGRFQASLIIESVEPLKDQGDRDNLLQSIWPYVEEANKKAPTHGRVHRDMIIFTTSEKPMLRAGKGTIQRKLTADAYAAEINQLYEGHKKQNTSTNGGSAGTPREVRLDDAVRDIIAKSTDIPSLDLTFDADLFELGLDSLQATTVAKRIEELLETRGRQEPFDARQVYANPSVSSLTSLVSTILEGKLRADEPGHDYERMQKLLDSLATNLPISGREPLPKPSNHSVVLLTGSTGSLGSYILDSLSQNAQVTRVYCLNRGPDSRKRQEESQRVKGLRPLDDKICCLDADILKPFFGLDRAEYKNLLAQVTDVVHNAWQVNFNLSLTTFASHVAGVRRLIDFSAHSKFGSRICFISSVSAVGGLCGNVAERIFDGWETPQSTGYGQSKFLSERLLDKAAQEADIPVTICRIGQVAGPSKSAGVWPKQEWFPSLVASSKFMGLLPETLGRMSEIDWVPVDLLGQILSEIITLPNSSRETNKPIVYHAVNPRSTNWPALMPQVAQSLGEEKDIKIVSLQDWLSALRDSASKDDPVRNPATKILPFYEELASDRVQAVHLDVTTAKEASPTLAELKEVDQSWMENWMRQWAF